MSNLIDFNKYKIDNGPDLNYQAELRAMNYDQIMDAIVTYTESKHLDFRKALALFTIALPQMKTSEGREVVNMQINHLKQEMKVLKKTYR